MEILSYKEAKEQYKEITSDPESRMHNYTRRQFVKEAKETLGDRRYNTLEGNWLNRGLWWWGEAADTVGQFDLLPFEGEQSIGTGLGWGLQTLTGALGRGWLWAKDDPHMKDALMNVGRELPAGLASFSLFAIPYAGIPLGLGALYGDAYNDALEEGRSPGEAMGAGGVNMGIGAATGGMGRFLGGVGKNAATRTNQKLMHKSLTKAGITGPEHKRVIRKLTEINKGRKWYQPRKGLNVRTDVKRPGYTIKPPSKVRRVLKESAIREGGLTTWGVVGDILDTAWFNEQLGVDQLLTDPHYFVPMLAGDSVSMISGSVIMNRSRSLKQKAHSKRVNKQKALRDAQQKLINRNGADRWMGPTVETDKKGNYSAAWLDSLRLEDHPGVHFAHRKNINENGDSQYIWYDASGYGDALGRRWEAEHGTPGEHSEANLALIEAEAPALVSYKTDDAGRIYDVEIPDAKNQDLMMIALRGQFGGNIRPGVDNRPPLREGWTRVEQEFGVEMPLPRHAVFEYITKEDGSDRHIIEQVLQRFGYVERTAPNVLSVTDAYTVHNDADARRRAARHMEYWDGMPIKQDWGHFIERFARTAQMKDVPMGNVRNEARRIYKFYKSKGVGEEMAMRLTLRTVERTGYQTFYNIYYGDAAKTDSDLARVVRYDTVHNGLDPNMPVMRVGRQQDLVEFHETAGVVFFHDPDKRQTLRLVHRPEIEEGRPMSIEVFQAGVKVREIPVRHTWAQRIDEDITKLIKPGSLTIDQMSSLSLAWGQVSEISKTPGVTWGGRVTDAERGFLSDMVDGFGLADKARIMMVKQSDLRDPKTLREMGMPVLGMYANTLGATTQGAVIHVRRRDPSDKSSIPVYLVVWNDQFTMPEGMPSEGTRVGSGFSTWIHELGHVVHNELFSRNEMRHFRKGIGDDYAAHVAKLEKKLKKKISELKEGDTVPAKWLRNFSDDRLLRRFLYENVGVDENGKLKPVTTEDIKAYMEHAEVAGEKAQYVTQFNEWMAEQFYKYAQKKSAPVYSSVDKFHKGLVDMWKNVYKKVFKGDVDYGARSYQEFMKHAHHNFYTKLMRERHEVTLALWQSRYKLLDGESEFLSRKLWESDYHPNLIKALEYKLDTWAERKRATNFNSLVHRAISEHKSGATMILNPAIIDPKSPETNPRLKQLDEIFFGMERTRHRQPWGGYGRWQGMQAEEVQNVLKTIDRALFGTWVAEKRPDLTTEEAVEAGYKTTLDPTGFNPGTIVEATSLAQSIVARWLQGELEGQHGPREGGTELLRHSIESTLMSMKKSIIETSTLKTDNKFGSKSPVQYFVKPADAGKLVEYMTNTHGNEGYRFEVQSRYKEIKGGKARREYFVVRKYDEFLARSTFDEKYTHVYDHTLSRSTSEQVVADNLHNLGHDPEVAAFHDDMLGDVLPSRAYPLMGQKRVWGERGRAQSLMRAGIRLADRVLDAFSGTGELSAIAVREGFKGEVLENTKHTPHSNLKRALRDDPEGFVTRVEQLFAQIENEPREKAQKILREQSEDDSAALWLAQVMQARAREVTSVKDVSIDAGRMHEGYVFRALAEARRHARNPTELTSVDGWRFAESAGAGDLLIIDPPYVGRSTYAEDRGEVTVVDQRKNLEKVYAAADRGANVIYFDSHPRIRQELRDRGFRTETVKGDEFVAFNFLRTVKPEPGLKPGQRWGIDPNDEWRSHREITYMDDMGEAITSSIKRGIDNELLPAELLEEFDSVLKELDAEGGKEQLDAIARDFGAESAESLNDLVALVMGSAFKHPKKTAEAISLLPDRTKNLMRGILTFAVDLADSVELKVRAANVEMKETGTTLDAVSDVKAGLAKAAEEKSDIGPMSTMMARLHPGGVSEARVEGSLWRKPFQWLETLYGQTFAGIQHFSESHPLIRDAATSLYMETGLQNKIYSDITDQFHAKIPPTPGDPMAEVDYKTDDPDRSFRVVAESPKLSDAYNQIRLLEQKRGQGLGELMAKNDKELMGLLNDLEASEQQAIADLVQRGHKAQEILTVYRNQVGREIDRVSAAKFLIKKTSEGDMTSREALGMIEQLDSKLEEGTPTVLEDAAWELAQSAGIDLSHAETVTMFFARLKTASAELHEFLAKRPFYVSERRMKQFHVSYIEKGDKTTSLADFSTLEEAEAFSSEVKEAGGTVVRGRPIDTQIQASLRNSGARDMLEVLRTATAKRQAVIDEMFGDVDPEMAKEVNELLIEIETDVSIEKEAQSPLAVLRASEGKKRKHKGGRERFNMLEQQLEHSRRVGVALARRRSDSIISLTRQDRDAQSDQGQDLVALVEQAKTNMRNPDPAAGVALSKFNFSMFLGMNMSSALIEIGQYPLTLTPILRELGAGAAESIATPTKLLSSSFRSMVSSRKEKIAGAGWTEPDHIEIIRRAEKEGRLNIRRYIDAEDDIVLDREAAARVGRGEDMRGSLKTWNPFSLAYRLGARMYAPFNRFNAELSLISIYETIKKRNPDMDPESLYTQSVRWADLANGSAGKANRPVGLFSSGTGATRTLAQTSFGLMSFTNAAVANWMRWIKKSQSEVFGKEERKASRNALTQAVALHVVGLGAMGVPLAASINTIFANLFGVDMEDAIRDALTFEDENESDGVNDFWANFALYGAMHATGMAPDIQTRLAIGGMAGINPYSGWDALSVAGPAASYVVNTVRALGDYHHQGPDTQSKMLRTATQLIPVGVRKAAQLSLTDEGQVRDRANRFITTPTDAEKAWMMLGFRPARVRDEQTRLLEITRAQNAESRTRKRVVSEALGYLRGGSIQAAQHTLLQGAANQEGTSYGDLYRGLEERYMVERFGRGYDSGTVTASKISAQGLGRYARPTNTEIYLNRLGLRNQFGMPARPTASQLRINQRADQFMGASPFMTSANAKSLAREEQQIDARQRGFSPQGFANFFAPLR